MTDPGLSAALQALSQAARRSSVARRLDADAEQALLQTIVDATVALFEAEASSIALFERDPDRLEFRVAAGAQGAGAIGLSVPPSRGIVGFVFSTGQPLALSDVMSDPRFDRATAERTGYVPRSIAAVPLIDGENTLGALQVLDKHTEPTFSLRDMELLAVFARQAAAAIRAARVQRDTQELFRTVLTRIGDGETTEADVEAVVSQISVGLDTDEDDPFWRLVDRVAQLRGLTDRELTLVSKILEVVAANAARGRRSDQGLGHDRTTVTDPNLPAWSEPFDPEARERLVRDAGVRLIDREWAWGGATGAGVKVAIIDSGVEGSHPVVGGRLVESVAVEIIDDEATVVPDEPIDMYGHATACAGIVVGLAPEVEIYSVRVLGADLRGKGAAFLTGLEWAVEKGIHAMNLSLSSKSERLFPYFHEVVDQAYFKHVALICAVNNVPGLSFPSTFSSVFSVAAHAVPDPETFFYNPSPPVEWGAWGVDVPIGWKDGGTTVATGNSFAAPHMCGLVARILSKHPGLTPFEVKTVLAAIATDPSET